jgi:hypothetical protein
MNDTVTIPLEFAPHGARLHGIFPPAGGGGSGGNGGQEQLFPLVHAFVEIHVHVFLPFCRPVGVAVFFSLIIYAKLRFFTFYFGRKLRKIWKYLHFPFEQGEKQPIILE